MSHVAGFTVAHDVSARDWQMQKNGKQWLLGKTFDTFCPLGPALVTKDSISGLEPAMTSPPLSFCLQGLRRGQACLRIPSQLLESKFCIS